MILNVFKYAIFNIKVLLIAVIKRFLLSMKSFNFGH